MQCEKCKVVQEGEANHHNPDGGDLCHICHKTYFTDCADCGEAVTRIFAGGRIYTEHENAHGDPLCESCIEAYTACADCGGVTREDSDYVDCGGKPICDDCGNDYTACEDCSDTIKKDTKNCDCDGNPVCESCHDGYITCADCGMGVKTDADYYDNCGDPICEDCSENYCHDEITDDTIHIDDSVDAIDGYSNGSRTEMVTTHRYNATEIDGTWYTDRTGVETNFIVCDGCNEHVSIDDYQSNDDGCYCEGCYPGENPEFEETEPGGDVVGKTFDVCKSSRRYGIEIEADDANCASEENDTVFGQKTDASLGNEGVEFYSPILQGDDGFFAIDDICKVLNNSSADCSNRCGLHVHIDLTDYSREDIARLYRFLVVAEKVTRRFVPSRRNTNRYCASTLEGSEISWDGGCLKTGSRYSAYNFSAYNDHKTVEIRLHQGTFSAEDIKNWTLLHLYIVDYVKNMPDDMTVIEDGVRELLRGIAGDVLPYYAEKENTYYGASLALAGC